MSSIGGWNSASLLPFIDYQAFRTHPKVVVGYSDFSAVLLGLHSKTGVVTFHGPAVMPSFGEWPAPFPETVQSFFDAVVRGSSALLAPASWTEQFVEWANKDWTTIARQLVPNAGWRSLRIGICEGILIGGNLDTLCMLLGTEYCPNLGGAILFFEETDCHMHDYERHLNSLRLHGVFERVAGIIVGKHERLRGESDITDRARLLAEFLPSRAFPVLVDVDLGHTAPMLTLPIGVTAVLDANEGRLRLLQAGVASRHPSRVSEP
jgi:muramoyltetrapeptide carboxypeptidase LdcA involved in peptidoglycan recycling